MDLGTLSVNFQANLGNLTNGFTQAQQGMAQTAAAAAAMTEKMEAVKPLDVGKSITNVDVAQAKLSLVEAEVEKARAALKKLENAANAGESVTGIDEARAKLVLVEARAQEAREQLEQLKTKGAEVGPALKQGFQQAEVAENQFAAKAQQAASTFAASTQGMVSRLLEFGSRLGMTVMGIQGMVQGVQNLGQMLIGSNASMEQTEVGFETVLHSAKAAHDEMDKLATFAANTPFEFPEIADADQKLLAFQFTTKQTLPLMTAIGDALSGLGKNTPAYLDQVVNVFGQMKANGKIATQDMLQLTSVGINGFDLMAKEMGKTTPQIRQMITAGLIPADKGIEALRKGMEETFGGGMQKQSLTFNGLMSTLQDNISAALRAFTGPLFDYAKKALIWLGDKVSSKEFQQFAKDMGEKVGTAFKNIGKFIDDNRKGFEHFINLMQQALKIINDKGLSDFVASLQQLGNTINQILVQPFLKWLQGAFTDKNVLAGAAQIGGAFHNLAQAVDWLNNAIKVAANLWQIIWPIIQRIGAYINGDFLKGWNQVSEDWNKNVLPAWNSMNKAMKDSLPMLSGLNQTQLPTLIGLITILGLGVARFAIGVAQSFAGAIEGISGFVGATIAGFTLLWDILTGQWDKIPRDFDNLKDNMMHIGHGMAEGMVGNMNMMLGPIGTLLDNLNNTTTGKLQNMSDKVVGHSIIPDMVNNIVSWFEQLGPRTLDAVQSMIGDVTTTFQNFAGNLLSGGTGGGGGGFHIPGFASGVENFAGGLARVHKDELIYLPRGSSVYPATSMAASGGASPTGSGGGGGGDVHVYLEVDGEHLAHIVAPHLDQRVRAKFGVRGRG